MAEYKFNAALNATSFPMLSRQAPRSVVISGLDNQLRQPRGSNNDPAGNNPQHLPQVLYCENVMPTEEGMTSVGYEEIQPPVAMATEFDEAFILRSDVPQLIYFVPADGLNYYCYGDGTPWVSVVPMVAGGAQFSIAYVNGSTYVCYAGLYLGHWNGVTLVDDTASLVGIAIADVLSISCSGNYLLTHTAVSVYWSTLTNPIDFSDVLAGAGTQIPVDIRGPIVCLTPMSGGFIIHCVYNAVAAVYTNNSAAPWIFREIKNAGGINSRRQVTTDNNSGATYIWGTSGLQQLDLRNAEQLFPDVSDFLAGRMYEEFDIATNTLSTVQLVNNLAVKLAYVSSRYLVASYGEVEGVYDYALVYDFGLKRWGKLKGTHVDCINGYLGARDSMFFMQPDGSGVRASLNFKEFDGEVINLADNGVILLGKYQLSRSNLICTQELELDLLDTNAAAVTVTALGSSGGSNFSQQLALVPYTKPDNSLSFQGQMEAVNVTYAIKGTFTFGSVTLTVTKGARF